MKNQSLTSDKAGRIGGRRLDPVFFVFELAETLPDVSPEFVEMFSESFAAAVLLIASSSADSPIEHFNFQQ